MPIDTLINKQDGFEQVRDRIALILRDESVNQQALAAAAGENPDLWKLRIGLERANPWNEFKDGDKTPIVNVWFDTDSAPRSRGNVIDEQAYTGTFNVDCYGCGQARDDGATGQIPGDEDSAKEAHRAARLCRNILMAAIYTQLDFPKGSLVESRWVTNRTSFPRELSYQAAQPVIAVRLAVEVVFRETAPQYTPETLEYVNVKVLERDLDGFLLNEVDFDYTT